MLILAIDTALSACSVAIVRDGETLTSCVEPMARGQAERLAPMVRDAMDEVDVRFDQLDRIAVTRGPGAFTGLRVGLAFARGLALALNIPCVGLSTLEVLAAKASEPRIVAAIEVAGSLFAGAWEGRHEIIQLCRTDMDTLLSRLDNNWAVTGPGSLSILAARPDWHYVQQNLPDPVILAYLAAHLDPDKSAPDPLYLRGVDAKLAGELLLPESLR